MSDKSIMKSGSNLERVLCSGHFAVTCECGPPKGADVEILQKKIDLVRDSVDAANVTDNQTAVVRMSSIAASSILVRSGVEPVMQMVTRDRNRIAAQSDIFGAYAWVFGICSVLPAIIRALAIIPWRKMFSTWIPSSSWRWCA